MSEAALLLSLCNADYSDSSESGALSDHDGAASAAHGIRTRASVAAAEGRSVRPRHLLSPYSYSDDEVEVGHSAPVAATRVPANSHSVVMASVINNPRLAQGSARTHPVRCILVFSSAQQQLADDSDSDASLDAIPARVCMAETVYAARVITAVEHHRALAQRTRIALSSSAPATSNSTPVAQHQQQQQQQQSTSMQPNPNGVSSRSNSIASLAAAAASLSTPTLQSSRLSPSVMVAQPTTSMFGHSTPHSRSGASTPALMHPPYSYSTHPASNHTSNTLNSSMSSVAPPAMHQTPATPNLISSPMTWTSQSSGHASNGTPMTMGRPETTFEHEHADALSKLLYSHAQRQQQSFLNELQYLHSIYPQLAVVHQQQQISLVNQQLQQLRHHHSLAQRDRLMSKVSLTPLAPITQTQSH